MSEVSVEDYPYFYKHGGEDGCGGVGFFMKKMIEAGKCMISADALNTDGSKIGYYTPITCGACGENVPHPRSADVFLRGDESDR